MRDIALTIPFELIKAMICRCGQVQEMEAYELAIERVLEATRLRGFGGYA